MSSAGRSVRYVALSFLLLNACASEGQAPRDTGDACDSLSIARCVHWNGCAPAELAVRYGDVATCESQEYFGCINESTATDTGLTAAGLTACAQALENQSCSDFLAGVVPQACDPVAGQRAPGASCAFSSQCASTFCAIVANTPCGTCQPPPAAGSSCASTPCGPGLLCEGGSRTCVLPEPSAAQCDGDHPCATGLTCVGPSSPSLSGQCRPEGTTQGASCDPAHTTAPDCESRVGLTCEGSPPTCQQTTLTASGHACGTIGEQSVGCQRGACALPNGQSAGICMTWAAVDESCDTQLGPGCLAPARCITTNGTTGPGTCLLPADSLCTSP